MDANPSHGLKEPQRLYFESPKIRRLVLGSYWTIIILALPFWWRLTSIERTALPSDRVRAQLDRNLVFSLDIQLDARSFGHGAPHLARELNNVLAQTLRASPTWRNLDIRVGMGKDTGARNRVGDRHPVGNRCYRRPKPGFNCVYCCSWGSHRRQAPQTIDCHPGECIGWVSS